MAKSATMRWYCQPSPTSLVVPAISLCPLSVVYLYKSTYRHTRVCLASALNNVPWFVGEPGAAALGSMGFKGFPTGQRFREGPGGATAALHHDEQRSFVEDPLPPESIGGCCPPSATLPNCSFLLPSSAYCVHRQAAMVSRPLHHSLHPVVRGKPPCPSTGCLLLAGELLAVKAPAQSWMALTSCLLQVGPGFAG